MQARSHDLLDIAECPILVPALQKRAVTLTHPIAATVGDCDVALTATTPASTSRSRPSASSSPSG